MKTLKPLIVVLLVCMLHTLQAQNSCFGTMFFSHGTSTTNIAIQPNVAYQPGWSSVSQSVDFGDGTVVPNVSEYVSHTYTGGQTVANVCYIVKAANSFNGDTCTDTLCRSIPLCQTTMSSLLFISASSGPSFVFQASFSSLANSWVSSYVDFGDGTTSPVQVDTGGFGYSISHTYTAPGTYLVRYSTTDSAGCTRDTFNVARVDCDISAGYTHTLSNDTATLTNTSTSSFPLSTSYQVIAKYAASGNTYSNSSGLFSAISKVKLPQDTLMNVCLVARDASGTCVDTFCTSIGIWQPCAITADFTFTQSGSAVLVYNNSSGNYPPLTYQWQAPGAWPSTSTATDTAFYYPSLGTQNICLIATNAIGCKDTFCTSITTVPTDTLCGMVFIDANSNGIYDGGEQVRPNSTVKIDGNTFLTDNTGFYKAPVISGPHVISLMAPPGWAQTFPDTPLIYNITTTTGDHICGLDFGMRDDTLLLSGIAYYDNNGNGLYDAGDTPRLNTIVIINGINGNTTAYTDNNGYYSQAVYSGTYSVICGIPGNYAATQPYNNNTYNITVYTTSIAGLNFGVRNNSVTLTGKVFIDANNNGAFDTGELGAAGQRINVLGAWVYTGTNGDWSIVRPSGTYTATYAPTSYYSGYTLTTPNSIVVNAATPGTTYPNNNFGVYLAPGTGDVCISLTPINNVWPFAASIGYTIRVDNYGNVPMSGVLEMNFDPLYTYFSANVTPNAIDQANYNLKWNVTVAVGQTVYIMPRFSMPNSTPIGTPVFNHVFYAPNVGFTDVNMACNVDTLHQLTATGYDPNDKYVSPIGEGSTHAIANVGQKLDYTIMFQNTGTAPAVNVILLDTIEADLDMESFVMKGASHDYRLEVKGQEIQWTFTNIMLPDSNTSVDSSIGYVSFSLNAKPTLTEGTLITNKAGIYFDYNDVVATGTAFNTIQTPTSIGQLSNGADITLQPNPFTSYTNLVITDGSSQGHYTLRVYDMLGKLVQQVHAEGNVIRIERNNMQQGMYMYEVEQDSKLIGKGKMIAE